MRRWQRIVREVADASGIRPDTIYGDSRTPCVCRARAEAAFRMRNELRLSFPEIGRYLDRHHTTIMAMIAKFDPNAMPGHGPYDPNVADLSGEWAI